MKNDNFLLGLSISISLHLLAAYLFFFGIPYTVKYAPSEEIIIFETVSIDDVVNIPTQVKKVDVKEEIKPEEAKKVLNTENAQGEEPPQVNKPEPPKEPEKKQEDKKPDAESIKTKEEKKLPEVKTKEVKESPKKEAPKPKPKEQPKVKKKENEDELESLLKTLESASKGTNNKSAKILKEKGDANATTKGPSTGSAKLSITEITLIKSKIHNLWNIPVGAAGISNIIVSLYISFEKDGSVKKAEIKKINCPPTVDANVCKITAENALRAVWRVSPIKDLRPERYDVWKEFNMDFKP